MSAAIRADTAFCAPSYDVNDPTVSPASADPAENGVPIMLIPPFSHASPDKSGTPAAQRQTTL